MNLQAELVAGKLTGKMKAIAAIGRMDYTDRFQPFGQTEIDVALQYVGDKWVAKTGRIQVPYDHPSPRIITHVGIFLYDRWLLDEAPKQTRAMVLGDRATFEAVYTLPETSHG